MSRTGQVLFVILLATLLAGCSGHGSPVEPSGDAEVSNARTPVVSDSAKTSRSIWGIWKIVIDGDTAVVDAIPNRTAGLHINAVRLLEVTPCSNCLRVENIRFISNTEVQVDFELTHPFPGAMKYTGFDVRGIFISGADFTFPESGRSVAWDEDTPRMLNPDGYTELFNPTDFPETHPPALGYIPGKYANGGDLWATLNPYVAYEQDQPRCMFASGATRTRTVRVYFPTQPIEFGYAVDACWQLVDEVTDPIEDFPPDANCLEAYKLDVTIDRGLDVSAGGEAEIIVDVYDHQGFETISTVTVEAPHFVAGEVALDYVEQSGPESWRYRGYIKNLTGAGGDEFPILVKVVDTETDQNLGPIDAWQLLRVYVSPSGGWARTWLAYGFQVAVDEIGNSYVAGLFFSDADFDPSSTEDIHELVGMEDIFVSSFDTYGVFRWARTWGGELEDRPIGIDLDDSGNLYVAGRFKGTADFDPGPGEDYRTSVDESDHFLSKLDTNGNYYWAVTWGGGMGGLVEDNGVYDGVAIDSLGDVYVAAAFKGTVDFDPGPGEDIHSSPPDEPAAFLSKFDASGGFKWVRTWGQMAEVRALGIDIDPELSVFVVGYSEGDVDLDPGPEEDMHPAGGFLSKFESNGNFLWARTWGGCPYNVAVDGFGNPCVVGQFYGRVDFDPGPGVDEHKALGNSDCFLSRFDHDGEFLWARTWGSDRGFFREGGCSVGIDNAGNCLVSGVYSGTTDFDPGPGEDIHEGHSGGNAFLTKFDSNGDFIWARTWGGQEHAGAYDLALDPFNNCYLTGPYCPPFDFNPGPGEFYGNVSGYLCAYLSKFPPDGNW